MPSDQSSADVSSETVGTQQGKLITYDTSKCRYCPLSTTTEVCSRCDPQRDWSGTNVTLAAFFLLNRHDDLGPDFPYVTPNNYEEVVYEETIRVVTDAVKRDAPGWSPPDPRTAEEIVADRQPDHDQSGLEAWA